MSDTRTCIVCGKSFVPSKYHSGKELKNCSKECAKISQKQYLSDYYYDNLEHNREKNRINSQLERVTNPIRVLLRGRKKFARQRGLDFTATENDIIVSERCPVFGVEFQRDTPYAMSLDRSDTSKGYTPENIQVISRKANTMKSDATREELIMFADWIYKTYG